MTFCLPRLPLIVLLGIADVGANGHNGHKEGPIGGLYAASISGSFVNVLGSEPPSLPVAGAGLFCVEDNGRCAFKFNVNLAGRLLTDPNTGLDLSFVELSSEACVSTYDGSSGVTYVYVTETSNPFLPDVLPNIPSDNEVLYTFAIAGDSGFLTRHSAVVGSGAFQKIRSGGKCPRFGADLFPPPPPASALSGTSRSSQPDSLHTRDRPQSRARRPHYSSQRGD